MEDLKTVIAKNLADCRRAADLTQVQLAEKLNYSDKAVSKWERGESVPDITVLCELAKLFGVTLDYLVTDRGGKPPKTRKQVTQKMRKRALITVICCGLAWLVATFVFAMLWMVGVEGYATWLVFIYAIPVSGVILIVFSALWANKYCTAASVSLLIWSVALSIYLSASAVRNIWMVFVIAVPLQLLTIFWFILRGQRSK